MQLSSPAMSRPLYRKSACGEGLARLASASAENREENIKSAGRRGSAVSNIIFAFASLSRPPLKTNIFCSLGLRLKCISIVLASYGVNKRRRLSFGVL
jgi:hypothetical protein